MVPYSIQIPAAFLQKYSPDSLLSSYGLSFLLFSKSNMETEGQNRTHEGWH